MESPLSGRLLLKVAGVPLGSCWHDLRDVPDQLNAGDPEVFTCVVVAEVPRLLGVAVVGTGTDEPESDGGRELVGFRVLRPLRFPVIPGDMHVLDKDQAGDNRGKEGRLGTVSRLLLPHLARRDAVLLIVANEEPVVEVQE